MGASFVDVVTCFAAEATDIQPELEESTAVSGAHTSSGATTAYKNGTFTWTLTPYDDPFGFRFCLRNALWNHMYRLHANMRGLFVMILFWPSTHTAEM